MAFKKVVMKYLNEKPQKVVTQKPKISKKKRKTKSSKKNKKHIKGSKYMKVGKKWIKL